MNKMMIIRSLVILTHARQGLAPGSLLAHIAALWRAEGRSVVVHQGLRRPPAADACLLHVDLTRVPPDYLALTHPYPIRINGRVEDVSRRRTSDLLVARDDAYAGPVIIKTNLNYYGWRERELASRRQRLLRRLADALPARWSGRLPSGDYVVLPEKAAVPAWVWRSDALAVERFLRGTGAGSGRVDLWYFLGRRSVVCPIVGQGAVLRYGHNARLLPMEEGVGPRAEARRAALGFDYGKFDVIETAEGARVIDANRTPFGAEAMSDYDHELCRRLAPGLDDLAV